MINSLFWFTEMRIILFSFPGVEQITNKVTRQQCTYNVTLRRVRGNVVGEEKQ